MRTDTNEAAAAIEARSDDVARRAVQLTLEAAPSFAARLDERELRRFHEEAGLQVHALVGSVVADDPTIFGDYAAWAAELLSRADVPDEQLAELLTATGRAITELVPAAASAVRPHLDAGERSLAR